MNGICDDCAAHIHDPSGRCPHDAVVEIRTSAGPIEKIVRCQCDCARAPLPLGTKDADTQLEVTR